jgi:glycosyltransferase involved in cell wall biosynthesis
VQGNYRRKQKAFTSVEDLVLVSPSQWLGDLARQSFLGKYPVRVIPNGIDTEIFRPRDTGIRQQPGLEGKKILLGVANVWSEKKGLEDFYRLAQMLPEEYQILLIGLTEQQVRELPDRIIGISRTESPQVLAEYYSAAHVFVNPTYEDTYPTVNLEAQACGIPVVCYDVCGCPETILPGMGSVVPAGDVTALKREAERWAMGEKPIPVSMEGLDCRTMARAYRDLYGEILRGREGAGP